MNKKAFVKSDSVGGIGMASRLGSGKRGHAQTGPLWVQQEVKNHVIQVGKIKTPDNTADAGMQNVPAETLNRLLMRASMRVLPDGWRSGSERMESVIEVNSLCVEQELHLGVNLLHVDWELYIGMKPLHSEQEVELYANEARSAEMCRESDRVYTAKVMLAVMLRIIQMVIEAMKCAPWNMWGGNSRGHREGARVAGGQRPAGRGVLAAEKPHRQAK